MDMHHSHLRPDGTTWPPVTPDPPPPPGYVDPLDALDDALDEHGGDAAEGATTDPTPEPAGQAEPAEQAHSA